MGILTLNKHVAAIGIGLGLTGLSYGLGLYLEWITAIDWLEVFCVFTSYVCTYLCVKESRYNYLWGLASVIALSFLFYNAGLYSSMVLNIYLIPTLIWGWFRWGHDSVTRAVAWVEWKWWPMYIGFTGIMWSSLVGISSLMGATLPITDSFILAGSILAQFLLDQKKLENWMVWAIVNVVAIATYYQAGLFLVAFQYVFFLANTVYGHYNWHCSMKARGLTHGA